MQYQVQELKLGKILDQAITLVKNHFGVLIGVTLVLLVPLLLIEGFLSLALAPKMPANPTFQDIQAANQVNFSNLIFTIPLLLIYALIAIPITNAAIIHAVACKYLEKPVTVGSAFRRAFASILPLIGTWILLYLAVFGGFILLIIPGIIFAFWFALSTQVVVIEGVSGFEALKRSKRLMSGNIGTIFVLGIVMGLINWGVTRAAAFIPQEHLRLLGTVFAQDVVMIFSASAFVVFYFSCRCKYENFDLTLLAESVGKSDSEDAAFDPAFEE